MPRDFSGALEDISFRHQPGGPTFLETVESALKTKSRRTSIDSPSVRYLTPVAVLRLRRPVLLFHATQQLLNVDSRPGRMGFEGLDLG